MPFARAKIWDKLISKCSRVSHDVRKFFGLLLKKNGYVLEQLYSPLIVHTTPEHAELKTIALGCITRHHSHHYFGFAETQWKLFLKESPRRVKPLLYVYRVLLTGIHLMRTGVIEANLVKLNESFQLPYIPDLVTRKLSRPGEIHLDRRRHRLLRNRIRATTHRTPVRPRVEQVTRITQRRNPRRPQRPPRPCANTSELIRSSSPSPSPFRVFCVFRDKKSSFPLFASVKIRVLPPLQLPFLLCALCDLCG